MIILKGTKMDALYMEREMIEKWIYLLGGFRLSS
jgi:hypothetical protein